MGRGRGAAAGGAVKGGLGAPVSSNVPDEPRVRHGPVTYAYGKDDLLAMLERARLQAAMNGELPHPPNGLDKDAVPLVSVRAGDAMYEFTVEGARGAARTSASREWTAGGPPAPNPSGAVGVGGTVGNHGGGKDQPEWADATVVGQGGGSAGFLGSGAVPRLTADERVSVFGPGASQGVSGFFGLAAPGGNGMGDGAQSKLLGALESDTENTNLGGGLETNSPSPPLHNNQQGLQNQQQQNQAQQNNQAPATGPITDAPWFYNDPSGTSQGPFKRAELLEWHDSGYFPLDLPLRPADAPPSMPFVPLAEMLECGWRYPGPRVAAQMRAEHEAQMKQQQQAAQAQAAAIQAAAAQRAQQEAEVRAKAERERAEAMRREQVQREAEAQRQAQMQQMQRQQQIQMQQQQQNGLHFGASPPQQGGQTLLANLFSGGGGGGVGGGGGGLAPGGPGPTGAMSLADLERSMGTSQGLPMAPAPGSFDAPQSNWDAAPGPSGWSVASPPGPNQGTHHDPGAYMVPASPPAKPAWGGAAAEPAGAHQASGAKSLAQIQAEEEQRAAARQREEEARIRSAPGNPVVGGVWGGGGGASGPSLAQIQAEEMRRAEAAEREKKSASQNGGGVQASMGGGGGVWGGKPPVAVAQPPAQVAGGGFWDSLPPAATQTQPPPVQQQQRGSAQSSQQFPRQQQQQQQFPSLGATAAAAARAGATRANAAALPGGVVGGLGGPAHEDAGGRPGAPTTKTQFQAWCRSEMKALNGSDDTTLVDFLVSLPSAGEVTEYVQLYLGDTARAAAFGKELIRIKRTSPQITGGLPGGGEFAGVGPAPGGGGVPSGGGASGPGEHDGWSQQPKKGGKGKGKK
jgi:hypothetical protein